MRITPDVAKCMYYTGIYPFTKKPVGVATAMRDRKLQRALTQFFKPENWSAAREVLLQAGRQNLIGNGRDCLIPPQPPKEAMEARRRQANAVGGVDHYHAGANPAKGAKPGERGAGPTKLMGYRPGRKTQNRRQQNGKKMPGL